MLRKTHSTIYPQSLSEKRSGFNPKCILIGVINIERPRGAREGAYCGCKTEADWQLKTGQLGLSLVGTEVLAAYSPELHSPRSAT